MTSDANRGPWGGVSSAQPVSTPPRLLPRFFLSAFLGLFLFTSIVGPALAIIPVAGVVGGVVVRGVTGTLLRKAGVTGVQSGASALSASGLFGVSAAAYIVICGQNYVSGNDCSGTPLAKIRPAGVNDNEGETTAATIPATSGLRYRFDGSTNCSLPGATGYDYTTRALACRAYTDQQLWAQRTNCAAYSGQTFTLTGTTGGDTGTGACQWAVRSSTGSVLGTDGQQVGSSTGISTLTCPSGYTLSGSNCVPQYAWTSDGVPSYRNNGSGAIIADPKDPDAGEAPTASPMVKDAVQPNGQPIKIKIEALPDGGVKVTTYGQGTSNGATSTTVNEFYVTSGGTPSATTNIYLGDVSTVYNNAAPTTNTPAPTSLEIPTDYQRDATGQQTNTKLQTIITDGLKVKEDSMPTAPDYGDAKKALDDATKARQDGLTTVTDATGKDTSWGFSLTFPATCEAMSFSMGAFGNLNIDICPYMPIAHDIMSVVWGGTTLFTVLGMVGRTIREA